MSARKAYVIGFISSIVLTAAAFLPIALHVQSKHETFSHVFLVVYILALAVLQLSIQLVLFLHLGREEKPHLNLAAFVTTMSLVLIVVIASLWIMAHLNYNMTPQQANQYILKSENFLQ